MYIHVVYENIIHFMCKIIILSSFIFKSDENLSKIYLKNS